MMTLASVIDPLRAANRLRDTVLFEWSLVSKDGNPIQLSGGLEIPANGALSESHAGDVLVVVASFEQDRNLPTETVNILRKVARKFSLNCGVEAATWALARAGLTDGRRVTTHWEDLETLEQAYPDTTVTNERFVMDGDLWTCGGASPAFDMMLYLIEQTFSAQLAQEVSSVFVYDQLHTASDKQPAMSLGLFEQNEPRVAAAIKIMEKNIDLPITTQAIAHRVGVSQKTLEVHFKRSLDTTPAAYHLNLRLQFARKLVIDTQIGLQEIAVRTGFGSQSSFSRSFKTAFGRAPLYLRAEQS